MHIVVSLLAILLVWANPTSAQECNVDLRPSDGYKELSEKLKCLQASISTRQGDSGSVKLVPGEPIEFSGCVKSSSLPSFSTLYFRPGNKLCRDDGSVWARIIYAPSGGAYIQVALPDEGRNFDCTPTTASCLFGDKESKQSFRLQVEKRKDAKGDEAWVGMLRKIAAE